MNSKLIPRAYPHDLFKALYDLAPIYLFKVMLYHLTHTEARAVFMVFLERVKLFPTVGFLQLEFRLTAMLSSYYFCDCLFLDH